MAKIRLSLPGRLLGHMGYHHAVMIIVAINLGVTAVLLAGAGSTSIAQSVYLVQLSYVASKDPPRGSSGAWQNITFAAFQAIKDTSLSVRVGYFGICGAVEGSTWICRRDAVSLIGPDGYTDPLQTDPLGLTPMAERIKDDVVFPGLLLGGAALGLIEIYLLSTFPGWHEERDIVTGSDVDVKPFPNRTIVAVCIAIAGLATLFTFTSALWQHTASATAASLLETSTVGVVKADIGSAGTALSWLVFALWAIVALCMIVLWSSIKILDTLTDDY